MSHWTDIATWRGPTVNEGDGDGRLEPTDQLAEHRGVIIHIAEGTFEGTIAWQRNPTARVSSHFVVAKDGRIAQMVDTDIRAWTQRDGNSSWLSIENEGRLPAALTAAQVEANARILACAHLVHGVPLQLATTPTGRGLGHHSMGAENGYNWGHSQCPGPAIKAQKPAIVARALQLINGEDDDMDQATFTQLMRGALADDTVEAQLRALSVSYPIESDASQLAVIREMRTNLRLVLADVSADDGNDISLTDEQIAQLAARLSPVVETGVRTVLRQGVDAPTPTS